MRYSVLLVSTGGAESLRVRRCRTRGGRVGGAQRVGVGTGQGVGGGRGLAARDCPSLGNQPADGQASGRGRWAAALRARAGGLDARSVGGGDPGAVEECPQIKAPRVTEALRDDYGYAGSVDLVRKRVAALRPPGGERAAQRTGYRPGQVMQVDWAECRQRVLASGWRTRYTSCRRRRACESAAARARCRCHRAGSVGRGVRSGRAGGPARQRRRTVTTLCVLLPALVRVRRSVSVSRPGRTGT